MKPQKLSKKLNPLGDRMNLQEAFEKLNQTKHNASFENLDEWLTQNPSKPKKMKPFYKIAASLAITVLVLLACTIPVQQEEEIGYMIKGITHQNETEVKAIITKISSNSANKIHANFALYEEEGGIKRKEAEIVMLLPKADKGVAESELEKLNSAFQFSSLELLPIEEVVEKPLYEVALLKINIKVGGEISEEVMVERINAVFHQNSSIEGNAEVSTDESGNRVIEVVLKESAILNNEDGASLSLDANSIKEIRASKKDGEDVIDIKVDESANSTSSSGNGVIKIRKTKH